MRTIQEVLKFIEESNGRIFSIQFMKRGSFELREMTCRTGVTKHLKGGERAYDPTEHHLVYVFDMAAKGYRCFPLEGLKAIKIDGKWESVVTPDVKHQQLIDDAMDKEL
jgi:hypothetical protein